MAKIMASWAAANLFFPPFFFVGEKSTKIFLGEKKINRKLKKKHSQPVQILTPEHSTRNNHVFKGGLRLTNLGLTLYCPQ